MAFAQSGGTPCRRTMALVAMLGFRCALGAPLAAAPAAEHPPAFAAVCFDDFRDAQENPSRDVLAKLLAPLPGLPGEIADAAFENIRAVRFSGLFRLAEPWTAGNALRISLIAPQHFQIYLWNGEQGIALYYRPPFQSAAAQWGAYGATRRSSDPRPERLALWATDEGRYERSGPGTFSLHWENGLLAMTRGDVVLLRVPLAGLPNEIYFDGQAMVRGLAWTACQGIPAPVPTAAGQRVTHFAEASWKQELPAEMALHFLPDGRAELVAESSVRGRGVPGYAALPVAEDGLCEYIFEVEDPQPGTGVILADENGTALGRAEFLSVNGKEQPVLALIGPKTREATNARRSPDRDLAPLAGTRVWLRLVKGAGVIQGSISGDGIHWSRLAEKAIAAAGACRFAGLYCSADSRKHSIKLRSLETRRLTRFETLVPEAIRQQVPPIRDAREANQWARWPRSQPADLAGPSWQRAGALQALHWGPTPALGRDLVFRFLDSLFDESPPLDLEAWLAVLREAALLVDTAEIDDSLRLMRCYERLGQQLLRSGEVAPFSRVRKAMLEAPLAPQAFLAGFPKDLLRYEILKALYEERWSDLAELARRCEYWELGSRGAKRPTPWDGNVGYLLAWASSLASAELRSHAGKDDKATRPGGAAVAAAPAVPAPPGARALGGLRVRLKRSLPQAATNHPLIERVGREDYNFVADVEAALAGNSYREAAQLVTSATNVASGGLVPHATDPMLLMSVTTVVEDMLMRSADFRATLEEQFGPLGELRFRQAAAAADSAAMTAVAAQFPGSHAAVEALAWLGDQALSGGWFADALGYYQAALHTARPDQRESLQWRHRLAAALLGRSEGPTADGPVRWGEVAMTSAEFEQLLDELRGRYAEPRDLATNPTPAESPLAPGVYAYRPWARCTLGPIRRRDWAARREMAWGSHQTAVTFADRQMIVNTPAHLTVLDLATGREVWHHDTLTDDTRLRWLAQPMVPAVAGSRLFVRRLTSDGIELAAFDLRDGRPAWNFRRKETTIVSDPLLFQNELWVLLAVQSGRDSVGLRLGRFLAESGELTAETPLAEFRTAWQSWFPCQATAVDNQIVASAGGCTFCCDLAGRIRWLRRHIYLPDPPDDRFSASSRFLQIHTPPLVAAGRVYATQPGVWSVECVDLASGRLLWRRAEPDVKRILSVVGDRVLIETAGGLAAWDARSGEVRWSYDLERLPDGAPARFEGGVFTDPQHIAFAVTRFAPETRYHWQTALVWLDPATGKCLHTVPLETGNEREPLQFGPLVVQGGRQWTFMLPPTPSTDVTIIELARWKDAE